MSTKTLNLITGGSGFVASRCILDGLQRGYAVRTTVRSMKRAEGVKKMLLHGGTTQSQVESVEFSTTDLVKDEGWLDACKGCTYILHVASPFPPGKPKHEDNLIVPARDAQSHRWLNGHASHGSEPYTEKDWTNLNDPANPVAPYPKSKTLAERAAWKFVREEGGEMEMAVVMPGGIFGPMLSTDYATTVRLVERLVNGKMPGLPQLWVGCVDVRDVANLHFRAMTDAKAKGERFLCLSSDGLNSMESLIPGLKAQLGERGQKIPTRVLPNWLLKIVAFWDADVALTVPELGKRKDASSEKAQRVLGWKPRTAVESLVATARSLEEFASV